MRLCPNCNREYKNGETVCPVCNTKIVETNEKGTARAISTLRLPKIPKKVFLSVCAVILSVALVASGVALLLYFANSTPSLIYVKNGDIYYTCENGRKKKLKEDIFKDMSDEEKNSFFEHLVKDENRQILIYPASTVYKTTETENLKSEAALRGSEEKVPYLTLKVLNLKNGNETEIAEKVSSFEYSSFSGKVIYEKENGLYSYDIAENESDLLLENAYYYTLSESGEYMIYTDKDAKGTYWQKLGEEAIFIEGISSFSKDLSSYAYIDGEDSLYRYTPERKLQHIADSVGVICGVYTDGKMYYFSYDEISFDFGNLLIDDCPSDSTDVNVLMAREFIEQAPKSFYEITLWYFDGENSIKLSDPERVFKNWNWRSYYEACYSAEIYDYHVLCAEVFKAHDTSGEKIKLSELISDSPDYHYVLSYLTSLYLTEGEWIGKIFVNEQGIDNPFLRMPEIIFSPNGTTVFFVTGDEKYPNAVSGKRTSIYRSDIKEGQKLQPMLYEDNVLYEKIYYLSDGSVAYFKEYMDYKRSGYLYRDRELISRDAHIDSVSYSEAMDALFWMAESDKEMTSGTLMMQKDKEILPVAYEVGDFCVCSDGVYYTAPSLSGEKYELYFFNGEKTKRVANGIDLIIE